MDEYLDETNNTLLNCLLTVNRSNVNNIKRTLDEIYSNNDKKNRLFDRESIKFLYMNILIIFLMRRIRINDPRAPDHSILHFFVHEEVSLVNLFRKFREQRGVIPRSLIDDLRIFELHVNPERRELAQIVRVECEMGQSIIDTRNLLHS